MVNGYSIVTYRRPLLASDNLDHTIYTNGSQAVLWAIGPLNQRNEVSYHSHFLKRNLLIDFGRQPKWNCPMPESGQPEMAHVHPHEQQNEETEKKPVSAEPITTTTNRNNARRRGGNRGGVRQQQQESTIETGESVTVVR